MYVNVRNVCKTVCNVNENRVYLEVEMSEHRKLFNCLFRLMPKNKIFNVAPNSQILITTPGCWIEMNSKPDVSITYNIHFL